ncbi:dirigent protein 1-like [Panicum miliaceum]|uniref:Dirigent protein n=1 Tax=Panicum miliaceum TaxID=4540 RepID=A0A3L6T939_PANMI|nr:dirigent protein 1-like [Panicum miliaceum]
MACCKLHSALLAVAVAVLAAGPAARPVLASSAYLHFYMHDVLTGPAPTAVQVLNGPRGHFGDTVVIDDALTEGASRSLAAVGRAQGHYIWA